MKDRVRISITLRPEIVNLLDSRIDGTKIRNRSHAVEHFLKEALVSPVGQAVVLVGDEKQVLVDICGETVIEKMLASLAKASVYRIIICCKENSKKLEKYLSKKKFAKFEFIYARNEHRGTGAALYECRKHLEPGTFFLIYGDVVAEIDFYDLEDFHKSHHGTATMVITSIADPLPWGIVRVKRNRIIDLMEKPTPEVANEMRLTNLINAGIYAFQSEIFSYMNEKTRNLEKEIFPVLIRKNKFYSYLLDGAWFNISREHLLKHALTYCTPRKKTLP